MKQKMLIFLFLATLFFSFSADKPAYIIFSKDGKAVKMATMIKSLEKADIVLFGEQHDNPIAHWLQFEVVKEIFDNDNKNLVLGAEMFEVDNQLILDEYLIGFISEKKFESESRLWPNYKTDYKPLVNFAKEKSIYFVATNVPRRYTSIVYQEGFEGLKKLTPEALAYIAPMPIKYDPELRCYKNIVKMDDAFDRYHGSENFPKAQAIKDATMAHFIYKNWTKNELLIHFNGNYHSDNFEGIYWYLKQENPDLEIVTISTVSQSQLDELEQSNQNIADFIICVPETMTKTH